MWGTALDTKQVNKDKQTNNQTNKQNKNGHDRMTAGPGVSGVEKQTK